MAFVVTVLFGVEPESKAQFRRAILANAAASLEREPGCRQFDVCEHPKAPEFFLSEIYDSAEAFQAHLQAPHFKEFDALCGSWVVSKQVSTYELLQQGA